MGRRSFFLVALETHKHFMKKYHYVSNMTSYRNHSLGTLLSDKKQENACALQKNKNNKRIAQLGRCIFAF